MPDIAFVNLLLEVKEPNFCAMPNGNRGQLFNLMPKLTNLGTVATGPFDVIMERSTVSEQGPYEATGIVRTIANLKPGEQLTMDAFQYNNCGGKKWYRVRLDYENTVKESDETNNSGTRAF